MREPSGRRADVSLEVPGEMRLIVEADTHGHLRDRLTLEQAATRRIDAATEQVACAAGCRTPWRSTAPDGWTTRGGCAPPPATSAARTDARRGGRADRTQRGPAVGRRGSTGRSPRWSRSRAPTTASMASAANGSSGSSSTPWSAWSPRTSAGSSMSGSSTARPINRSSRTSVPTYRTRLRNPSVPAARPSCTTCGGRIVTFVPAAPRCVASRSYRIAPWSTMNTVHVSWVCGGYAWSTNRAWKTSWMPGTAGFHARTHSRSVAKTGRSYKTPLQPGVLDGAHEEPL